MTVERLKSLVAEDFDAVNAVIVEKIQSQIGLLDDLSHHIIESGGKRLRPLLLLLSSRACAYEGNAHINLAAMVEFFHTATLLHDDVVDESTLRRGKETANEIWGSKASILVGDYLFTQSVQLMVSVNSWPVLHLLADTSHQITCGEVKQLANKNNPSISEADYYDVIRSKTAILFAACSAIGAQLAKVNEKTEQAMHAYGLHLGNAFQLIDDAMDYCSSSKQMGKNIGDDLADGKATLPLIYAMQKANPSQKKLIEASLKKGDIQQLPEIMHIIEETKAIDYTRQCARTEIDKALSQLNVLPESPYKQALIDLAHFAVDRNH